MTDPLSGAGISHAFISGKIAASSIKEAIENDNLKYLRNYEKQIKSKIVKKIAIYKRFRLLYEKLDDDDFCLISDFMQDNFHDKTSEGLDILSSLKSILFKYPRLLRLFGKITF